MVKDSFQKLMLKSFILGFVRTLMFKIFFNHGEGLFSEIDAKILQNLTTRKSFSFMFLFPCFPRMLRLYCFFNFYCLGRRLVDGGIRCGVIDNPKFSCH